MTASTVLIWSVMELDQYVGIVLEIGQNIYYADVSSQ